jgi:hypothetical protein
MTTKPPASVKEANPDEPLKKIYDMVEEFKEVIPVTNERYRLAFNINKFYNGESASLAEALSNAKPESCTIDSKELLKQLTEKFEKLGLK